MKDGTQILDCKVVSETATSVSVRTPVGDMVVPRSEIYRIQKTKTAYDLFAEQLARVRENDAGGLFKLAAWCRATSGLRKDGDELLERVISLKPDHAEARRLLGHLRVAGKWVVPEQLAVHLKVAGPVGKDAVDLREHLSLFLQSRADIRLASEGEAADPLNGCVMTASVSIGSKAAPTFYGKSMGRPTVGASVGLRSESPWIGKEPLKVSLEGQVPAGGGREGELAVKNALGGNSLVFHKYLDQFLQLRSKALSKDLQKSQKKGPSKGRPKSAAGGGSVGAQRAA